MSSKTATIIISENDDDGIVHVDIKFVPDRSEGEKSALFIVVARMLAAVEYEDEKP